MSTPLYPKGKADASLIRLILAKAGIGVPQHSEPKFSPNPIPGKLSPRRTRTYAFVEAKGIEPFQSPCKGDSPALEHVPPNRLFSYAMRTRSSREVRRCPKWWESLPCCTCFSGVVTLRLRGAEENRTLHIDLARINRLPWYMRPH